MIYGENNECGASSRSFPRVDKLSDPMLPNFLDRCSDILSLIKGGYINV